MELVHSVVFYYILHGLSYNHSNFIAAILAHMKTNAIDLA